MLHKIANFTDPALDRQIREIVDAINNFTLIHKTTGKPYLMTVDDVAAVPAIVLTEIQ